MFLPPTELLWFWKLQAIRGATFHSLLVTCWNSLLLVTRSKITRYLLQNSLVTRCRSYSLQEFTPYLFHKLLVAKNHSLLAAKFSRYLLQKKLLIAKNHSSVVAKFACYSLQQITCYSMKNMIHRLLKQS